MCIRIHDFPFRRHSFGGGGVGRTLRTPVGSCHMYSIKFANLCVDLLLIVCARMQADRVCFVHGCNIQSVFCCRAVCALWTFSPLPHHLVGQSVFCARMQTDVCCRAVNALWTFRRYRIMLDRAASIAASGLPDLYSFLYSCTVQF